MVNVAPAGVIDKLGSVDADFEGHEPVIGLEPPRRPRTTPNALDIVEYMAQLARRGGDA